MSTAVCRPGRVLRFAMVVALAWAVAPARAADEPKADKEKDNAKAKEKPDFPEFKEVTKDHEPVAKDSFLPLYYDKKKDHLLAVIPAKLLEKNFLLATSISGGPRYTGFQWGHRVVQWHEKDKKLVLIEPELRYKMGDEGGLGDVIRRTYTDRIVLATPIVSKKNGDPVIDLDKIFKQDFGDVARVLGGTMNAELSQWAKYKGFEHNVVLEVDAAIMQGKREGIRARVAYSISELPTTDYQPRMADNRIGYFLTAVKDWTRDHADRTLFRRYIHRWHLRKENPSAEVSDVKPEDQIVFYIEKTVPEKYRRFVREGILEWNKAFENAGLRNAVAVMQQTDTVHADKDPEDVSYNFFRWIVSGRAFAVGPSRANPITGQILDADILFDDSFVRSLKAQYARLSAKGPEAEYDPTLSAFLERQPEWGFGAIMDRIAPDRIAVAGVDRSLPAELLELPGIHRSHLCTYAEGMCHEMCFADAILQAAGGDGLSEEYIGQMLRWIVTHEVGHTLGLRHNFKASSWLPLDEILGNEAQTEPTSASVMDYLPPLFATEPEAQARFITTTLGPYDYWAIDYGYRVPGKDEEEKDMLGKITARVAESGLAYATDEDTGYLDPDPLVNRFDQGDDPVAYARHRMEMVRTLNKTIADWAVKDGESYSELRKAFDMLLYEYGRCARYAARVIGGEYVHRHHKGDPDARLPFEMVPVAKQREALDFIVDNVFSDRAFQFDPEVLNKLAPGRWRHWDSDAYDSQQAYPIHDRIAAIQYWSLFHVANPFTITRIYDAELKTPPEQDVLTVPELTRRVTRAIWSELDSVDDSNTWTDRKPLISSLRRGLQRRHQEVLTRIVLDRPGRLMPADAHAVMRMTLSDLSQRIGSVLENKGANLDDFSRAHLDDAKNRIDKALDADFSL
ncbi:MAG: zinc-dependent metalloprotease [Phycisphaerales bacterium]|nr:MAG: zinc-dependent metalloprotease [Phycisphaerales bacterium]